MKLLAFLMLLQTEPPKQEDSILQKMEREVAAVVAKVKPSVVAVTAKFTFKVDPRVEASESLKFSGVIYRKDGYIITDASGVVEAEEITVTLSDDRRFPAKLVAADLRTGIAVLKIDAKDLPEVELADGKEIRTGIFAISVGNAYGMKGSAAVGYVSGLDRTIAVGGFKYEGMLQMSTPVNPGDCGGLVADAKGRLIGLVNSTYQAATDIEGMGLLELFGKNYGDVLPASPNSLSFATHAETIRFVADRIIKHKRMVRGRLGVTLRMIDDTTRKQLAIDDGAGAEIVKVEPKSPAKKAGFKTKDIVLSYDGEAVKDLAALKRRIESLEEPKTVKIVFLRAGEKREVEVRVELDPLQK